MAYLINFYTQYAVKIANANYSDPEVVSAMASDTAPTDFCILSRATL